jgi:hypothetical protein
MQQHLGHFMSPLSVRPNVVRGISAAVTALAVGALVLVAVEAGGTVTRHTVVTRHEVRSSAPARPAPSVGVPTAPAAAVAPTLSASPAIPSASATAAPVATEASTTSPVNPAPQVSSPTPSPTPSVPAKPAVVPACPLPLAAPTTNGGLQSLVAFSPFFGPFSAEAFASAALFQPVLELFGPFLATIAEEYTPVEPQIAPLVATVESLENEGYSVLAPLYGPYREQFLTAETTLATALAPLVSAAAINPVSECVVDIEGMLAAAH